MCAESCATLELFPATVLWDLDTIETGLSLGLPLADLLIELGTVCLLIAGVKLFLAAGHKPRNETNSLSATGNDFKLAIRNEKFYYLFSYGAAELSHAKADAFAILLDNLSRNFLCPKFLKFIDSLLEKTVLKARWFGGDSTVLLMLKTNF